MQLIKPGINIDFIGKRKIAFLLSLVMILVSIGSLLMNKGPRYGIDFAGGTLVQVKFESPVAIDAIKSGLQELELAASAVQRFGQDQDNEYLLMHLQPGQPAKPLLTSDRPFQPVACSY